MRYMLIDRESLHSLKKTFVSDVGPLGKEELINSLSPTVDYSELDALIIA